MDRFLYLFFVLFLSLSATASSRVPLTDSEISAALAEFQYPANYIELESDKDESMWNSCWTYRKVITTQMPNATEPVTIHIEAFIPSKNKIGSKKIPAVVMLPPIGGVNFLDSQMAETFCDKEIAAYIITDDFASVESQASGDLLPPEDHHMTYYKVDAAVKAVMALAGDNPSIDSSKFGIFGVSLGGILSAFAMSTLPEISAGYFVVSGGDVPNILALSTQEKIESIREQRMEAEGLETAQEYEDYLRQFMKFDPLDFARTMLPETIRMVIAQKDKSVPSANQMLMHEAFGKPETEYYKMDHVDTVIATMLYGSERRRIANFFLERFKTENPRPNLFQFLMAF